MNKMKKLIIVVTSLIAMIVILVGCSNEKNKQTNQDNGVLKSGSMWKEEVGGLVYNLKIIDETTWEYSESVWHPDPVQITVKRQKDYKGLERYKIVDSASVREFINKSDSLFIVVPYEKNGVKKIIFLGSSKDEKRTKEKLIHDGSQSNKYKLQKTSE